MIITLYLLLIVPFYMGILEASIFKKQNRKMSEVLINGYLLMMACFCVISVAAVYKEWALSRLALLWLGITVGIVVWANIAGRKQIKTFRKDFIEFWELKGEKSDRTKRFYRFIMILGLSMMASIFFTRPDSSDRTWEIVYTAVETDTMYQYDEYSGYLSAYAIDGHQYAPIEMLYAVGISLTGISPTIVLYYLVPLCLLFFFYLVFWRLGTQFFEKKEYTCTFVGLSCAIYWMTTYLEGQSVVTGIFLNSWNGMTFLSCFVMPAVLSTCLEWLKAEKKNRTGSSNPFELLYRILIFLLAGQLTNEKGGFYILLMLLITAAVKMIGKGYEYGIASCRFKKRV